MSVKRFLTSLFTIRVALFSLAVYLVTSISVFATGGLSSASSPIARVASLNAYIYLPLVMKSGAGATLPTPTPTSGGIWRPALNTSWQWQLTGTIDQSVNVAVYDIDGFDNSASVVASLHAKGRKVICYISAGTFENWRSDAGAFPASVKGNGNGWPGENWLDIRQISVLGPIMGARMDMCKQKGFDAIEPDNIDGYSNSTGFPLTATDQLTYNQWLASAAHARGLSIGLKNDIDQVVALEPYFDWALNEECFSYNECAPLSTFVNKGKGVFEVEYDLATSAFCPEAIALNFNALKKDLDLTAYRVPCR